MDTPRAAQALARASAGLTRKHDVAGELDSVLSHCKDGLQVDAAGILVGREGGMELLAASSHDAVELELHQAHLNEGPCVEAHAGGTSVQADSREEILRRWPVFGPVMIDFGFHSVHASPLQWQGTPMGAMGLFRRSGDTFDDADDGVAQAFADIATALIVHFDEIEPERLSRMLGEALFDRVVIEQAKGVLANEYDLSMADAFELLVQSSRERHESLTSWAARIVSDAHRRPS